MPWLVSKRLLLCLIVMIAARFSSVLIISRPLCCRVGLVRLLSSKDDYVPSIEAKDIVIPLDKVEFSFARSSGPGGQNVNKLNTKAEIRFNVEQADWIAPEVKQRLVQYQQNRISKEGELFIACQEHRTQAKNKADCIEKLKEMIAEASIEPKEREMWEGIGEKGKAKRKEMKQKRKEVKQSRRVDYRDYD